MVRRSEDVHPNSVVTSFVEPSLNDATAFSCVVPPMFTTAGVGAIATDVKVSVAVGPAEVGAGLNFELLTAGQIHIPQGSL